jgi:hypothetical protein
LEEISRIPEGDGRIKTNTLLDMFQRYFSIVSDTFYFKGNGWGMALIKHG